MAFRTVRREDSICYGKSARSDELSFRFVIFVLLGLADARTSSLSAGFTELSLMLTKPKRSGGGFKSLWNAVKLLGSTLLLKLRR